MHRSLFLAMVFIFCVATSLALIQAAAVLKMPPITHSAPNIHDESASIDSVQRFYDAINEVLRTGDATRLHALITLDFVDHVTCPSVASAVDGLETCLLELHAMTPGMRLVVESIDLANNIAVVHLRVETNERSATMTPTRFRFDHLWGDMDVVRLQDEGIAEHWGGGVDALLHPLISMPMTLPKEAIAEIIVEQYVLKPSAELHLEHKARYRAVFIEAGRPKVQVFGSATLHHPLPSGEVEITPVHSLNQRAFVTAVPRDLLVIWGQPRVVITAADTEPSVALVVTVNEVVGHQPVSSPLSGTAPDTAHAVDEDWSSPPPGVQRPRHETTRWVGLPSGRSVLTLERLVIAPARRVMLPDPNGSIWLAVESGHLTLTSLTPNTLRPDTMMPTDGYAAGAGLHVAIGPSIIVAGNDHETLLLLVLAVTSVSGDTAVVQWSDHHGT